MEFIDYLKERNAPGTVKRYFREVELFSFSIENTEEANYNQIMEYLGILRQKQRHLNPTLFALKKYYQYLIFRGKRKDNPAASIKLRDQNYKEIQLQDLFTKEELEKLLERKERYPILENRNKIIISLLIYQGLTNGEIKSLTLENINLKEGTIYIKAQAKTNKRTLKLRSNQSYWLMQYLLQDRPKLLKIESNKLLITKRGTEENGEGINYLIETQKHLFPERKLNPKTIRQSVITNLLKEGKDLRLVQVFAGHKYSSATEKYKEKQIEKLKCEILKYHPLG